MFDDLIVILIVITAIGFAGRAIYRSFSKDGGQCGCGSDRECEGCTSTPSACAEGKKHLNSDK